MPCRPNAEAIRVRTTRWLCIRTSSRSPITWSGPMPSPGRRCCSRARRAQRPARAHLAASRAYRAARLHRGRGAACRCSSSTPAPSPTCPPWRPGGATATRRSARISPPSTRPALGAAHRDAVGRALLAAATAPSQSPHAGTDRDAPGVAHCPPPRAAQRLPARAGGRAAADRLRRVAVAKPAAAALAAQRRHAVARRRTRAGSERTRLTRRRRTTAIRCARRAPRSRAR